MKSLLTIAIVVAGIAFSQDGGMNETEKKKGFFYTEPLPIMCGTGESCSLQGKPKVFVVVETTVPGSLRSTGFSKQQLTTEVELLLRKFGVPIGKLLTADLVFRVSVIGQTVVYADGRSAGSYHYSIECQVLQDVRLDRNPSISVLSAVTWDTGDTIALGPKPKATIMNVVKDKTKRFVNAYLEANPK